VRSLRKLCTLRIAVGTLLLPMVLGTAIRIVAAADPKIIEAAKKEGELGWWSTIAQDQSQKIVDEFMKLYPFIKASYWRSGSVGIHNKVLIEARAGRTSWDVVSQTTPEFINELKQKKVIGPYNSPSAGTSATILKIRMGTGQEPTRCPRAWASIRNR
jgi:hypothetical protein